MVWNLDHMHITYGQSLLNLHVTQFIDGPPYIRKDQLSIVIKNCVALFQKDSYISPKQENLAEVCEGMGGVILEWWGAGSGSGMHSVWAWQKPRPACRMVWDHRVKMNIQVRVWDEQVRWVWVVGGRSVPSQTQCVSKINQFFQFVRSALPRNHTHLLEDILLFSRHIQS